MVNAPSLQKPDIICFSELPWESARRQLTVFLPRYTNRRRVFCFEESAFSPTGPFLDIVSAEPEMWRIIPTLPTELAISLQNEARQSLIQLFLSQMNISYFVRVDLNLPPKAEFVVKEPVNAAILSAA